MRVLLLIYFVIFCACNKEIPYQGKTAWQAIDNPENLALNKEKFEYRYLNLPRKAQLQKMFWSGSHWPTSKGGISYRWNSPSASEKDRIHYSPKPIDQILNHELYFLSATEKYDIYNNDPLYTLTNAEKSRTKTAKIFQRHVIPEWLGLCHALAPATLLYKSPKAVTVKLKDGRDLTFSAEDIKALLVYFLHSHSSKVYLANAKCHVDIKQIKTDLQTGKISQVDFDKHMNDPACKGLNAGSFHLLLGNLIGIKASGFFMDLTLGTEVWNHAVVGYEVEEVSKSHEGQNKRHELKVRVKYVKASKHFEERCDPEDALGFKDYHYALEVNSSGTIIGGQWLNNEIPDFAWIREFPEFNKDFKLVKELYEKASSDIRENFLGPTIELFDNKVDRKCNLVRCKLKLNGTLSKNVHSLVFSTIKKNTKTKDRYLIDIEGSGRYSKQIKIWRWQAREFSLAGFDESGHKLFERRETIRL